MIFPGCVSLGQRHLCKAAGGWNPSRHRAAAPLLSQGPTSARCPGPTLPDSSRAGALATRWRDLGSVRAGVGGVGTSLCILPDGAVRCSLPLLSILLSHWNNRGMWPLQRHSKHANTLPPAAPTALMDTCACCCCGALIFQLPSPLTSPPHPPLSPPPHSLSPIFLTFLFGLSEG